MDIASIRTDYKRGELDEAHAAADPIEQFSRWWAEARRSEIAEVNAMTLATASAAGRPSARTVLLKDFDSRGFVFYTNYDSRKGRELTQNANAALLFFWPELERQVRIEGDIERVAPETSTAYFHSRPFESQLGAASSPQSQVIASRDVLDQRFAELANANTGRATIERPAHWGGFALTPHTIEFWQGRPSRMHDRIRYRKSDGAWVVERLAP